MFDPLWILNVVSINMQETLETEFVYTFQSIMI